MNGIARVTRSITLKLVALRRRRGFSASIRRPSPFLRIGKIAVFALIGHFGFGAVSAADSLSHSNADGVFDGLLDRIGGRQRLAALTADPGLSPVSTH